VGKLPELVARNASVQEMRASGAWPPAMEEMFLLGTLDSVVQAACSKNTRIAFLKLRERTD
jgi:hypothetical protein